MEHLQSPSTLNQTSPFTTPSPRFPPEVVLHILEQAEDPKWAGPYGDERACFMSASLVCQDWRGPGQKVLWKRMYMDKEEYAARVLASSVFAVYPTRFMFLKGAVGNSGGVLMDSAVRLMSGLRGITELRLDLLKGCNLALLSLPNLSELKLLTLSWPDSDVEASPKFSFDLTELNLFKLNFYELHYSSFILDFYSPSLTHLTIDDSYDTTHLPLYNFLRKVAPQLHCLNTSIMGGMGFSALPLIPYFTSLRVLRISLMHEELAPMLEHMTTELQELHFFDLHNVNSAVRVLVNRLELPCLAKRAVLGLEEYVETTFLAGKGATDLVSNLKGRGVLIKWSRFS